MSDVAGIKSCQHVPCRKNLKTINNDMNNTLHFGVPFPSSCASNRTMVIAIAGSSGFIGSHLVNSLLKIDYVEVRTFSRNSKLQLNTHPRLKQFFGNLNDIDAIRDFLVPGCTLINLAFGRNQSSEDNIRMTRNLVDSCRLLGVKRVIHCSTASVWGQKLQSVIDESTPCNPNTEYGRTKLEIERLFSDGAKDSYDLIKLRPTSVFGSGSPALSKLIRDLQIQNSFISYLRSCFLSSRKLNLVSIYFVINSVLYFTMASKVDSGQIYIISQDNDASNIFSFVEKIIFEKIYGKYYGEFNYEVQL